MQEYIKARARVLRKERVVRSIVAFVRKATMLFYAGFLLFVIVYYGIAGNVTGKLLILSAFLLSSVKAIWLWLGDVIIGFYCRENWKEVSAKYEVLPRETKESMLDAAKYTFKFRPKTEIAEINGFRGRLYKYEIVDGKAALYTGGTMTPYAVDTSEEFDASVLRPGTAYSFDSETAILYSSFTIRQKDNSLEVITDKIQIRHTLLLKGTDSGLRLTIDFTGDKLTKFGDLYFEDVEVSFLFISSEEIREQIIS